MSALAGSQFGQHLVGHLYVVALPRAVGYAQCVHVGVLAQIFQFRLFVVGVHGDKYGTNLCGGIEEGEPVGNVGGPYAHV